MTDELHPPDVSPAAVPAAVTGGLEPAGTPLSPVGFLDAVYGALFAPEQVFRRAAAAAPYGASMALVAVVAALEGLAEGSPGAVLFRFGTALAVSLVSLGVAAGALGLLAEWLGGHGRTGTLFALLGLTQAPHLVALPLSMLGKTAPGFGFLGGALGLIWSLTLVVPALRYGYGLTAPVAVAVLCLGLFLLVVVPVLLILALAAVLLSDPGFIQSLQTLTG